MQWSSGRLIFWSLLGSIAMHLVAVAALVSWPPVGASGGTSTWGGLSGPEAPLLMLNPEPMQQVPPQPPVEPRAEVPPPLPAQPERPTPREITLGTSSSQAKTTNWLVSNKDGEHSAPESSVEQPGLKLTDRGGAPGVPRPPAASPTSRPASASNAATVPDSALSPREPVTKPITPGEQQAPRTDPSAQPGKENRPGERDAPAIDRPEGPAAAPTVLIAKSSAKAATPRGAGGPDSPVADQSKRGEREAKDPEAEPTDDPTRPMIDARGLDASGRAALEPSKGPTDPQAEPRPIDQPGDKPTAPRPAEFVGPPAPEPGETREAQGQEVPVTDPAELARLTSAPGAASNPSPPTPPAPPSPSEAQAGEGGDGMPDDPAWLSDREADASSIRKSVKFLNGRVEAGEGLDIRTVRPRYTLVSKSLARPTPPVVEAWFDDRGIVREVKFLRTSGYDDVDAAIGNAVWQWRASGNVLENLRADASSRLRLRITFVR